MLRLTVFFFVCMAQLSLAFAQMTFESSDWTSVLTKAKQEKKLIFVDAYTEWCGPCKMMARNTFPDKEVGKYFNANFVNYKLDMEKGEGLTFANTYKVNAYPTLMFIKPDGTVLQKVLGYREPASFLKEGEAAVSKFKAEASSSTATQPKNNKPVREHWWQFWRSKA